MDTNDKNRLDGPADAMAELKFMIEYNGIKAKWEGGHARFFLSSKGVKWETRMDPLTDGAVMIYSYYPFNISDLEKAESFCQDVNRCARYGAMLCADKRLIFRIGADLFDTYSAYETLGRALEYSAGIMVRFWVKAKRVCIG